MSRADLERAKFEAFIKDNGFSAAGDQDKNSFKYWSNTVRSYWIGWQAALASQAPAVPQELVVIQRTKNPYTIGTPETYWRRGYNGVRMIGYPSYASKQFYKEGEFARESDDLAALSLQGDAEDAARYQWLRDVHVGDDPGSIGIESASKPGLDAAIDAARKEPK